MIPALIVFAYLAVLLYIGIFAFRRRQATSEDFFVAGRSLGPWVFLLTLFGTNMTAFTILGSSGLAYHRGIGVYGLMASSSGLVIPLTLFLIGTRLWAVGKRHGHMTQVQFFRDRWECGAIGTVIFALTAAMMLPYVIIGVMGGGETLQAISGGWVPYWVGGLVVALVVMAYVFFGGMRGVAWVNAFQTTMFLIFGGVAVWLIARSLGGFDRVVAEMAADPQTQPLLTRERISPREFFSYTFIPLSSIMFPHMAVMCMTAKRATHFKKTVVAYPICILLVWLPSVFLGVVAAHEFPGLKPGESDDVLLRLLHAHTDALLAGALGAAIMACVMATDSQIMALSTMFSEDLFRHYGGRARWGETVEVWFGRACVIVFTLVAYALALALENRKGIFDLAVRFGFSGFAALAPVMLAALFWRRSTKWGALAATLWVAAGMAGQWWLFEHSQPLAPAPEQPPAPIFPTLGDLFLRTPTQVTMYGYMPVMFLCLGSAFWMVAVSLVTPAPSRATLLKYFPAAAAPSPADGAPADLEPALIAKT
jgi:SSS family solute:Na+ symporter